MIRFAFASAVTVGLAALLPSCASKRPPPVDDVGIGSGGGSGAGGGGGTSDGGTTPTDGGSGCGIGNFVAAFVAQRTVHLSPQGNDANDGTALSPWRSMKNAARLQAGDLVQLADGTYPCAFDLTTQGSASNPVVIKAEHAGAAVFECASDVGITLSGARYVAFDGVVIRGATGDLVRIQPVSSGAAADHIVIQNARLESNGAVALRVVKATQVDVARADVSRQTSAPAAADAGGIDVLASNGVRVVSSRFHDYPANIAFQARAGSENVLVDGNAFTAVAEAVRLGGASTATDFPSNATTFELKTGLAVNNLVYGTVEIPFEVFGCDTCLVANNTTYLLGAQAALRAAPGNAGSSVVGGSHTQNLRLLQNLFVFAQTAPQRLLDMGAGELAGLNQARNLYFSTSGSVAGVRSDPAVDSDGTLIDQDPRYQDPARQAFSLLPGSPALERGKAISEVSRDGYGACRTVQNLGAF